MSDLFLPSVSDDLRRSSVFSVLFALAALQSERTVNVLGVTSLWTTSVLISAWDWYDVHMLTDWIPSGPIWLKNMFLTDDETALELLKWFVLWSFKKEFILLFWRWLLFRSSVTDFVECTGFICAHWGYKKIFFSSHVPSYSMPSFLHLCSSSHRADGCPHNERLKGDKLFGYPLLFQILWSNPFSCGTSGGLWTIFCVWLFSFGLPPSSWVPLPTLHVVERLSHPPSPPGHCAVLTAPCCCGICPPCVLHDLMQC